MEVFRHFIYYRTEIVPYHKNLIPDLSLSQECVNVKHQNGLSTVKKTLLQMSI